MTWHPILIPGLAAEDLIPHLDEGTGLCLCDCSACSVIPEDVDGICICICPECSAGDENCAHEPAAVL